VNVEQRPPATTPRGRRLQTVDEKKAERAHVALSRSVEAVEIPAGTTVTLPAGTPVTITQTLGGNFTVAGGPYGMLYRIAAKDADALGREPPAAPGAAAPGAPGAPETAADEEAVRKLLKTIYDPEIPVNIVDLGLVYGVTVTPFPEGGTKVHIEMTLTAPGCGMSGVLKADAEQKVAALPGVREVDVEIVWDPPWDRDRMSDAAKLQLGML
jgi:probable FeS assembly SUF system protein SufT